MAQFIFVLYKYNSVLRHNSSVDVYNLTNVWTVNVAENQPSYISLKPYLLKLMFQLQTIVNSTYVLCGPKIYCSLKYVNNVWAPAHKGNELNLLS